jgi:hypothetical protein
MIMMHWKKWDGENWVKALEGYTPKPQKSPLEITESKHRVFL